MANSILLQYEIVFHWLALLLYLAAAVFFFRGVVFLNDKSLSSGIKIILIGLLPHTLALLFRWSYVGHGPYLSKYEVLSSNAWMTLVFFLFFSRRHPKILFAGLLVASASFIQLAAALLAGAAIKRLPAGFNSPWLVPHVFFTKLAVGAFVIAVALMLAYALKSRGNKAKFLAALPGKETLDEYIYRITAWGFCCWTITLAAGAFWARESWERYWGWDPVETWSLITWLLLGGYLHLRLFFNVKGMRGLAVLALCYTVSILTIFALLFPIDSLHGDYFR